jgi:hypothetical protein
MLCSSTLAALFTGVFWILLWMWIELLITALALYALYVRTNAYGLTVSRVWGFFIAVITFAYALSGRARLAPDLVTPGSSAGPAPARR